MDWSYSAYHVHQKSSASSPGGHNSDFGKPTPLTTRHPEFDTSKCVLPVVPAFFSGNHLCHIWSAGGVSLCIVADNVFGRESQIRRSPWKKTQETVQEEEAAQEKGDSVTRLFHQRNFETFGIFWYYLAIWYHRCMWYVVFSDQIIIVASFPSLKSHCYIDKKKILSLTHNFVLKLIRIIV